MPPDQKTDRSDVVGSDLLKEWTLSFIQVGKTMQAWLDLAAGDEDNKGYLELLAELGDNLEDLGDKLTGTNLMLARVNAVFDKLVEVNRGRPDAEPPVEPRIPTIVDVAEALDEFDRAVAEEAEKAEKEEKEEAKAEVATMIQSRPTVKPKLPPPPIFPRSKQEPEPKKDAAPAPEKK